MPIGKEKIKEVKTLVEEYGLEEAQKRLGVSDDTMSRYMRFVRNMEMQVSISGLKPVDHVEVEEEILPYMRKLCERAKQKSSDENSQVIDFGNAPFGIVNISDIHFGGKIDIDALEKDMNTILNTPRLYVFLSGDLFDNFIIGKLQSIQTNQPTTHAHEIKLVEWFLNKMKERIIVCVTGNHDNWTYKLSGVDYIKTLVDGWNILYARDEARFTVRGGAVNQKWIVRHKFKYKSLYNPTHGAEVNWERGDYDYDVAVAGHEHRASLIRPFVRHGKVRYAVCLGTYKIRDEYARENGFARCVGNSSAFIYKPDGSMLHTDGDVQPLAEVLRGWVEEWES